MLRERATAHVRHGLALMATGMPADIRLALGHFDRALAIRRELRCDAPVCRFDLAGAWMNRAEALRALGADRHMGGVVAAYDAALVLLDSLPLADDRRFPRRLATALQNRALAHRAVDPQAWSAVPDLIRAISVLETASEERPAVMLATLWVNLADAQLDGIDTRAWSRSIESSRHALNLLGASPMQDLSAAAVALNAWHVTCRASGRRLERGDAARPDLDVYVATDAAEHGLELIALWERRGVSRFGPYASQFFEYARGVYQAFQPHFVAEFEAEHSWLQDLG